MDPPDGPPTDFQIDDQTSTSITASWTKAPDSNNHILKISTTSGGGNWTNVVYNCFSYSGDTVSFVFGGGRSGCQLQSALTANTTYYIDVAGIKNVWQGPAAGEISGKTLLAPPTNVAAEATSTTALKVTWTNAASATSHQVRYKLSTDSSWPSWSGTATSPHNISGLTTGTTYDIQVRGRIAGTNGNDGQPRQVSGTTIAVVAPTGLWYPTDTDDYDPRFGRFGGGYWDESRITVFWSAVAAASWYEIRYRAVRGTAQAAWSAWAGADEIDRVDGVPLSGLFPAWDGTAYEIEVRGVDSGNNRGPAASLTAKTRYDQPTPVRNLRLVSNDGELGVYWTAGNHND